MNPKQNRPLTIVHTEASHGWGGQEIRIFQEARWFRERGDRVVLMAPEGSEIYRRGGKDGFETVALAFEKRTQWSDLIRLVRYFRKLRPDVVGTHSSVDSWGGLLAGRIARVPVNLRYRHVSAPVHPHLLNRFLYRRCSDHVLTTAECIRRDLVKNLRLPESQVTTAPTGIRAPEFGESRETAREGLCRKLGVPLESRFIGCVAVLRNWKGQDFLMSAFDTLANQFPAHRLVLVGDGPGLKRLDAHRLTLKAAERMHLAGYHPDTWPFFRGFDAAVLPSYKDEGIPQSLLQAMFAECPVIGSEAGGIPEIVLDGRTGLLAPPRSVKELAECIKATLEQPRETEGRVRQALELVRSRHTLAQMGETVLGIIQKVLHDRPSV